MNMRHTCVALLFAAACGVVGAQTYPVKPVRMVNPFSPGGSLDLVARALAKTMTAELGQPVVVENRAGAGGNIGVETVAKSAPDGYTLLAVQSSITINPSLQKQVPYDPIKDFEPISKLSSYMFFLVVHPSTQARSVQQLIVLAKARPNQLNYASVGVGSGTHLAGELFKSMASVKMTHIPYKGSGPSIIDLVGGHVALMFGSTSVLPHVQTKKLVLLGVSGAKRSDFVPEAPTIAESGLPGYEVTAWNALFAPAGTPSPIVNRLNALVKTGLAHPESKAVMEAQGLDATPSTPAELGQLVRTELAKWAKVINTAGIKAE
ncbi:MAG TPA: tripartite tricarboxylate transporter substrate binding protein [Burkholderiales bacterium]|nr:tripartite tricarboxylate transporter substrate binding protein [Burkholderiales bacterium]